MKTTDLKPQHQTTQIAKLLDAKAQVEYLNTQVVPHFSEMESWEVTEYKAILKDYTDKIEMLKAYIIKYEADFNDILWYYDLTVTTFIAKHIN